VYSLGQTAILLARSRYNRLRSDPKGSCQHGNASRLVVGSINSLMTTHRSSTWKSAEAHASRIKIKYHDHPSLPPLLVKVVEVAGHCRNSYRFLPLLNQLIPPFDFPNYSPDVLALPLSAAISPSNPHSTVKYPVLHTSLPLLGAFSPSQQLCDTLPFSAYVKAVSRNTTRSSSFLSCSLDRTWTSSRFHAKAFSALENSPICHQQIINLKTPQVSRRDHPGLICGNTLPL